MHIEKPSDVLKVGDEVTAKIVDFNEADKKISLSITCPARLRSRLRKRRKRSPLSKDDDADVVSVDIDAVIAQQQDTKEE